MPDWEQVLLQTKFNWPRPPKDVLTRTRLEMLLSNDIHRQLILVCAPAGFGKTTLVSTWLNQMAAGRDKKAATLPSAWISLDENDSDLNRFLRYFIAALRTIYTDACEVTLALLQASQPPPEAFLHCTFINELEKLPGEIILVLDDYHSIQGTQVPNLLSELVNHWPGPLHMVLISRLSPSLPLSNMRARAMLSEIRTRDLRFTPEETADYLSRTQFALMGQKALTLLEERFEGWSAGLHLAALSLRSAASQEAVLRELSGENQNITEYLVEEVLSQQPPPIHAFLLKTSILDRFCTSLCEAVVGEIDPIWNVRACLDWIEHSEMFIIPLDQRRKWYRYHHLFQDLLRQRMAAVITSDEVHQMHLRASTWFEEHGLIDEALHHALAVGDLDLAAHQMSAGLREVLNREDRPTLERWLRLLPEELIRRRPDVLIIRAWALQFTWQLNLQANVLLQIDELLDSEAGTLLPVEDVQILRGQILLIQAQYTYFSNQTKLTMDMCREVLAVIPLSWTFARGSAMLYLGFSMQNDGQVREAVTLLLNEYELCIDKTDIYPLILLQTLGYIYLLSGQLEKSRQIGQLLGQGAILRGNIFTKSWGDYYLGVASYLNDDLETANTYFAQLFQNRYIAHMTVYRDAIAGLALIHQIRGESAEAWQMVDSLSQYDLEQSGIEDDRTRSLRARLMLLQGDREGAGNWINTLTFPPPDQPLMWLEEPQVTRARVLLASNTDTDRQLALQQLNSLDEIVERTHNIRYKIEVLAMRAVALDAQGDAEKSNAELLQALDLAGPGGFTRVFVDLGLPMQKLLRRLDRQGCANALVPRILAAFPEDKKHFASTEDLTQPRRLPLPEVSTLVESLTPRELEILSLLRGPSSIKEIALQLNISYATAKRHTINIYAKLGVNQRRNAVARADELNIL